MEEQQMIQQFFRDDAAAISYIRNRLLGKFDDAPPPTSDRFIEEYTTDVLQHLVGNLEDKGVFWNACFRLFKEWRDPEKAERESAAGMSELIYMIRQFNQHPEGIFDQEKDRWQEELAPKHLGEQPYVEQQKNAVYVQNLTLVHLWNLWPVERWTKLYKNILRSTDINNEAQFELILIVTQHLDWDTKKTGQLFQWAVTQDKLPETFYNQYFFHRLCLCGNSMTDTSKEEQEVCQSRFVDDTLKTQGQIFYNLNNEKKEPLGKFLLEAVELFDLKSFKCLRQQKIVLLKRELEKLAHPPPQGKIGILKSGITSPSSDGYMDAHYAGDALQPA